MGSEVITVEQSLDKDILIGIIKSLGDVVVEDGANVDDFTIDVKDVWLLVKVGGVVAGAYWLHAFNGSTIQVHANMLPEHRKTHTKQITEHVHSWIAENMGDPYKKYIAMIPCCFDNVIRYCISSGWRVEGVITKSYMKYGKLRDLYIVGATIEEIKSWQA